MKKITPSNICRNCEVVWDEKEGWGLWKWLEGIISPKTRCPICGKFEGIPLANKDACNPIWAPMEK